MGINNLFLQMTTSFSSIHDYFSLINKKQQEIVEEEANKEFIEFGAADDDELNKPSKEEIVNQITESIEDIKTKTILVYLNDRNEYYLSHLCKAIQKETKDEIHYCDFAGNPIEKTNRYLKHKNMKSIIGYNLAIVVELQKIRNCIVHCNSKISESKDKNEINKLIRENKGLFNNNGELLVNTSYVLFMINEITRIIHDVYKENGWGTVFK